MKPSHESVGGFGGLGELEPVTKYWDKRVTLTTYWYYRGMASRTQLMEALSV